MNLLPLVMTLAFPTVDSENFTAEQQRAALAATVRIILPSGQGTGAVVRRQPPFLFILTAAHVVKDLETVKIETFDDDSYPNARATIAEAKVMNRWPNADLALLRVISQAKPGVLKICPPTEMPKGDRFAVLSVGCSVDAPPTCVADQLTGSRRVQKPDGSRVMCWEAEQAPIVGRSGGPLVDKRGFLIGVCSGTAHKKGFYTHVSEIQAALESEGWKFLVTGEP